MTASKRSRLASSAPLLIDGGTGTELRRRGVELDPVAWSAPASLTHPALLTRIHADYLEAGADVITTNTFAATRFVLDAAGLGQDAERIVRSSVGAAIAARERTGRDALIAGAVSCLPPGFDVRAYPDPSTEREAYAKLAASLADAGVDLLVLEMMEDVDHARRATAAVRGVGLPFWLGLSARRSPGGELVAYDFPETRFRDVLDALLDAQPAAVNVMHTPAADVVPALREVASRWNGPFGAYPEIGEPPAGGFSGAADGDAASGEAGSGLDPAELAALAEEWLRCGASGVGGCCGTTPEHIRALRALLDQRCSSPARSG